MGKIERDFIGYSNNNPSFRWPNNSKIAVQFVLNYEEGAENCILNGDDASETFLSEIIGALPYQNARHMSMESIYEYGSRAGVWRILDLFRDYEIPITVFGVAKALQKNLFFCDRVLKDNHEICSHGLRWINYNSIKEDIERAHMHEAIEIQKSICGYRPLGWYTGRTSENTRKLVAEEGGFLYDSDDYSDDLPFWSKVIQKPHLIIPYTLDANDMRFATNQGFNTSDHFFNYLLDSFNTLYEEGNKSPKMMSIGLHCRIIGRPGRFQGLKKFVNYISTFDDIWIAKRVDIAKFWIKNFPYKIEDNNDK